MGVYTTGLVTESYNIDLMDSSINENLVRDFDDGAATTIIVENEQNWTSLMRAVGLSELTAVERDGDAIYEAADGKGFFAKIKAFFNGILDKIKALFKKFLIKFESLTKSGKDFVKKYAREISRLSVSDSFSYKGYVFTHVDDDLPTDKDFMTIAADYDTTGLVNSNGYDVENVANAMLKNGRMTDSESEEDKETRNSLKTDLEKMRDDRDDTLEKLRGDLLKGASAGRLSSSEFDSEIFKYFRNDSNTKEELKKGDFNIDDCRTWLSGYEDAKSKTEKEFRKVNKAITKFLDALDKCATKLDKLNYDKEAKKSSETVSIMVSTVNETSSLLRSYSGDIIKLQNGQLAAMKDRASQSRSILVKLLTSSKAVQHNSADLDGELGVTRSLLDDVQFV